MLLLRGFGDSAVEDFYQEVLNQLEVDPITSDQIHLLDSRIVHDLGISGDDFVEFIEVIKSKRKTTGDVPAKFIPTELSMDSYLVAMCRSWQSRRWPPLLNFYRWRIRSEPLTVRQLHALLFNEEV